MKFQFSGIQRFLSKFPGFSRPDKHPLAFLNVAQFTGVLNDNIYKLVLVFFLIELEGPANASLILSMVGAIFVIPFLLFSSVAGALADRFSKSRIIMLLKGAEILLFALIATAFAFKLKWVGYGLLFLLSTHSALFGPSKYGIIPELVPKTQVSKANGLITSFTYLAIILGTFLASFMTEITGRNFVLVACFSLFFAFTGFISTFGIPYTPPRASHEPMGFAFIKQIFKTLSRCRDERHLLVAISGSSFFLFIGAYTQLNVIPFAMESLNLSEVAGGYLFLATAMGIALGAFLAGRASKALIELGLSCLSGLLISLMFVVLASSSHHLFLSLFALFTLGVFGGCFVVPFDSFIQVFSPEKTRGHVIAATNFLSFCGVLLASFALYFFNNLLNMSPASSFIVMAVMTLLFTLFLILRLSDLFFSYLARKILMRFVFKLKATDLAAVEKSSHPFIILENASFMRAWQLWGLLPNLHLLLPHRPSRLPWLQSLCYSIDRIPEQAKFEKLLEKGRSYTKKGAIPCLYLKNTMPKREEGFIDALFKRKPYELFTATFTRSGRNVHVHFTKH